MKKIKYVIQEGIDPKFITKPYDSKKEAQGWKKVLQKRSPSSTFKIRVVKI